MRSPFSYMKTSRQSRQAQSDVPPPAPAHERRSVADAIRGALGQDAYAKASSPSTQIAVALGAKQVYAGTVAKAVVQRRRAANKRARVARRVHRRAVR